MRDAIILSVIQLNSIEKLGRKQIKEYFDVVIDGKDHDKISYKASSLTEIILPSEGRNN